MSTPLVDSSPAAATVAPTATDAAAPLEVARRRGAMRKQVRGSSLLMAGRLLGKLLNYAVQIVIVRYLTKDDWGAFAYALSVVAFVQALATFGLDRAITRYLPIFQERGEYGKLFGTVLMVVATVVTMGLAAAVTFLLLHEQLAPLWIKDPRSVPLLVVLMFLAPLQALDELLIGLFAVFTSPRSIFFRKYVLAPLLKLTVVLLVVATGGSALALACGYVGAGLVGTSICLALLVRMIRRQNLLDRFDRQTLACPWREVLAFTVPLLTSELVYVVMHFMDALLLERYWDVTQVGALRAVQPLSLLNQLVMASFATLFTPLAARMFARDDRQGINELYWQTAVWIAVFSFPVFALTFSLAEPITVLSFGNKYHDAWLLLALLSLGHYFNAATGFNGLTLKVCGKLKFVVAINLATALLNLSLGLILIPRYGAVGAATGSCISLVVHNLLKQTGLLLGTGVRLVDARYLRVYAVIVTAAVTLGLVQYLLAPSKYWSLALAAATSLAVLRACRDQLHADQMFPELLKLPLAARLLGRSRRHA